MRRIIINECDKITVISNVVNFFPKWEKKNVRRFKLQSSISIYVLCSVLYNSFISNFYEFEEDHTTKEPTFFFSFIFTLVRMN